MNKVFYEVIVDQIYKDDVTARVCVSHPTLEGAVKVYSNYIRSSYRLDVFASSIVLLEKHFDERGVLIGEPKKIVSYEK